MNTIFFLFELFFRQGIIKSENPLPRYASGQKVYYVYLKVKQGHNSNGCNQYTNTKKKKKKKNTGQV